MITHHRHLVFALGLAAAAHLHAQTAPAAPASRPATPSGETITLTPFEVSTDKDRGYFGGNTLAGGRADTPLRITPASISVMTKEFLEDFDLTDMNQALAWTVGADAPTGGESGAFGGNRFQTSFRGVDGNGNFPVRNGSINYYVADSYNSERYDFSRGPNAALFGDGGPGGLQGSTSKQARLRSNFTTTSARIDSFGGYRATLDTNYGTDRLAIRMNLLHQNIKAYQDGTSNKQNGLTAALTYKITDNTRFRAEVQRDAERNVAYRRTYGEQASRWDRTTVNTNNTAIASFANFGLTQISATQDYQVWNFGTNSLLNYRGNQYASVGLGYQIPWEGRSDLPNFRPGVSKDFFLGPADAVINRDFNAQSYWLDHRFSQDLYVQIGIVKNDGDPHYENTDQLPGDYRIDVNRLLPNGQPNPNFGKAYSDFGQNFQYQQDRVREYKVAGTYKFALPRFFDFKQRFSINAGWRRTTFEAKASSWRWANNPAAPDANNAMNQLRYRIYWDNPRPRLSGFTPPSVPGVNWAFVETGGNINQRTITYGQLVSQSTFFGERLALTGSVRRDRVHGDFLNRIGNDPVTYRNIGGFETFGGSGVFVPGLHRKRQIWQTSPSGGLVAYPFIGKSRLLAPLGFVANYSSNFAQIANATIPLISEDNPPLTRSTTKDIGLRYAMGDGIAYVTLTKYNTQQFDQLSTWGGRGDWQNLYNNLGFTDTRFVTGAGFNFQDVASRKLEGWEAEITANPTRNITLTANYSHPIVYTVFESRDRRAFFEANRAYYDRAGQSTTGTVVEGKAILAPDQIRQAVQNIENSLNGSTPGTLGNNLERHRVNLAGSYRITEGRFKGLGLNGGFNYRAHKKVGSRDPRLKFNTANPTVQQTAESAYDYLWVDPTWSTTAGANYTRRFGKVQARFQINITNLLDDDSPQWNSYSVIQAGQLQNLPGAVTNNGNALTAPGGNPRMQVKSGFNQLEPRKFSFTTTLSF
ncbi:MAG: TonB-dependent receptor plug domain-containing protein [Opitutaceae bacterium]|nr:TonB-dependent receptor plug domain-containing protein [Opitutaceae bacterium]